MSLNSEELDRHCHNILNSRRALSKIVILCEGQIPSKTRRSPQAYGRMEQMPDSNFYKACIPHWWKQSKPEFFNCGDRTNVINTYFRLIELNKTEQPTYLDSNKLFAIIDLDSNQAKLQTDYPFVSTEAIYYDLYQQHEINRDRIDNHRIWVTGLIHKEAYFLLPELQEFFNNEWQLEPQYKSKSVILNDIYKDMVNDIVGDRDLGQNFQNTVKRIEHDTSLDCTTVETLQKTFQSELSSRSEISMLIRSLFAVKRVKPYWKQIDSPDHWTSSISNFYDQLSLQIARFYSYQTDDSYNHLSCLFLRLNRRFY